MSSVTVWTPRARQQLSADELHTLLTSASETLRTPFSDSSFFVLEEFSRSLLKSTYARAVPQLVTLGFWLRKAAITELHNRFNGDGNQSTVKVPRGLAYHLPPANVDTLFIYSWALSFVVGNSNVIRVPSNPSKVALWCLEELLSVLDKAQLDSSQIFCSYNHSSTIGKDISAVCDLRVIWGGDEKVRQVSLDPVKPDGLSIGFSDRKSLCLIKTEAYARCEESERLNLAEKFYNDLYWFDQLGCGSPRVVVWVGKGSPDTKLFYELLSATIEEKGYRVEQHTDISKLVFANELVGKGIANRAQRCSSELTVLDSELHSAALEHVHGGGLLFQMSMDNLSDITSLVRQDLQTLTTFGFDKDEKIKLARELNGKGGYRIVPVGSALNFNSIWDGIDLLGHFSRQITIE